VSKNVAVFVDVANIFYAAKAAGVDIDYVTLLKSATAGRDFVRAYAYTGLDPENENQRNFHQFLARNGYKVVSKDIRKYGDGRVKANLDIEMVVDMMKTARNLDVAVLVSGDGDFAPAIRAVQEMGVRVEVICFKANTSSDLIDAADQFIEITHIAKVEKDTGRSGRRVAGDEEDLSMTEVPEKQTEGATERRRRTRARGAETTARTRRAASPRAAAEVTVLPGEKLARLETAGEAESVAASEVSEPSTTPADAADEGELGDGEARRRRRRRRGRGRGRAREDSAELEGAEVGPDEPTELPEVPRAPRAAAFGSVWDSQIGVPSGPRALSAGPEDEDVEEPEVPEYLLAERRARGGGRGRGTGRRDAYRSAMERERYGRGGRGHGVRADVLEGRRDRRREPGRESGRPARSREGWSEVPPEVEAMLRAQLAARRTGTPTDAPTDASAMTETAERAPVRRGRSRKAPQPVEAPVGADDGTTAEPTAEQAVEPKPARRTRTRKTGQTAEAAAGTTDDAAGATVEQVDQPKPARRTRARKADPAAAAGGSGTAASSGDGGGSGDPPGGADDTSAVTRRRPRTKAVAPA
jgi:uncharacterized LabA/DUF88 family protein